MITKIAVGSDHAGFTMKKAIKALLQSDKACRIKDYGCSSESAVDYPNVAHPVALAVGHKEFNYGILFCGSANGMAMTANKHMGIRAAVCWDEKLTTLARRHNDANILCLPARFMDLELAKKITLLFLKTPFDGGRHKKRVNKIDF